MSTKVEVPKEDPELVKQREQAEARADRDRAEENEEAARVGTAKILRRFGMARRGGVAPGAGQYVPPAYYGFLPQAVLNSLFKGQSVSSQAPAFLTANQSRISGPNSLVKQVGNA